MTPTEERAEILRNARRALKCKQITRGQYLDVWRNLITDLIERMVLGEWAH